MYKICLLIVCLLTGFFRHEAIGQYNGDSQFEPVYADGVLHTVAAISWDVNYRGNHRALVSVKKEMSGVVKVHLPWRRPDPAPEKKRLVIIDSFTGKEVKDLFIEHISAEEGSVAFRPSTVPGNYEIYYLPYIFRKTSDDARYGAPWNDYLAPEYHPDAQWLRLAKERFNELPRAEVLRFEARKKEDLFTAMGLIATRAEEDRLKSAAKGDFILFPEDRAFPIRLTDRLPLRWADHIPGGVFTGEAAPNEYYTLQSGVFAHKKALANVRVSFSDLVHTGRPAAVIPKDSLTCFNQEGTGWNGQPVSFTVNVPHGEVRALWLGISVPDGALPGVYEGMVTVTADNSGEQKLKLRLTVSTERLADRGDGDLWRHARLRWLNSTLGIADTPVPPYGTLLRKGNVISAGFRQLELDRYGLPARAGTKGRSLFSSPVSLSAETPAGRLKLAPRRLTFHDNPGRITWNTQWTARGIRVNCLGVMEFDGSVAYSFSITAEKNIDLADIRLGISFAEKEVPYLMGIGLDGGKLPPLPYTWNWQGPWDSFWAGNANAGIHVEFQGSYNGPLLNDYKPAPPPVWANGGKGFVRIDRTQAGRVTLTASAGPHRLTAGSPLTLAFKLLITPVKERDTRKHFTERYYQGDPLKLDRAVAEGANVINIHHNTSLNPYINYPFIVRDSLAAYIRRQHDAGRRVKLYYTIRELSNYAPEIYALRSLGQEIFPSGPGQGSPWLWEHLNTGYKAAWYAPFPDQTADASIVMNGFSRWINYYIEGLRWMLQQYQIDGLYLDDVAYDREVIQRLRRVLLKYNPDALIDLHSNTNYSVGPANQYTAFFPYIDRLWFGESFKYNDMTADQWLMQVSGIPFGLMGEMLEGGGNKWLGMLYGMTVRHSWGAESPAAVWKYWDDYNIKDAKMYGYWDDDRPVDSDNDSVKITVYAHKDKLLLSVANFSGVRQEVTPVFKPPAGFGNGNILIRAPAIEGFQGSAVFEAGKPIEVEPKKGWLLEVVKTK